ncbi:helix-turn-helix domain-containing GNAT family N-acetyltransferase [Bosea sp. (in: a-proteobacteria)]|uniref:bifunctional helix-turn-helix transcriptional regulator/GNAT family N-acetyltransferase n=1 Tax=Bosea sp. (in: a-proteobacteria) TaxID=1871050 RepID=UPI0027347B09|nr:helix-turn-helix domain-containing GNAT family N-acetyltransferase [Bosea sp. (in: a-proteobacteria)]MDP3257878.1 helix-turn-helix domain-containing GNAT family N-acetyltransferase [Bosea sp. (in: a-proteobacteria)]
MSDLESAVAALRRFNRFHTRLVGALGGSLLGSGFTLTEARVLYELARRDGWRAGDLAKELGLDPAYLSRILKRFAAAGWLLRERSAADGRALTLRLSEAGHAVFHPLEEASQAEAAERLCALDEPARTRLVTALTEAETLLSGVSNPAAAPVIRPHRPGDIGWVISAHGRIYAEDYGWDIAFEAFVAEIAARFLRDFRPGLEQGLIAERDGQILGSAFVMRESDETAKLRMVIVDRPGRGLGLGKALVREAIRFTRAAGYARLQLWTNDILHAARAIYIAEGFKLIAQETHHSFGQDLVGQNWELVL